MASVSALDDCWGAPFIRVMRSMTFLAMVMKAAHTFILDLADVSKNGIWEEDEGRGWKRRRRRRRQKRGRRAI